jgi:hypothetical protein
MQPPELSSAGGREIRDVALLDLTGADSAAALEGVTRVSNVATILVPEALLSRLSSIPMERVAATVPVRDGQRTRVMAGQIVLSGEALAGPDESHRDDMLVIAGQLILSSPVKKVGYADLVVLGQVIAPTGSETALGAGLNRLSGQVLYYPYADGATVRTVTSSMISGEALANSGGQPTDILLATNQLVVTSPIQRLGYQHVIAVGHLVVPSATSAELLPRLVPVGGQLVTTSGPVRVFERKDHFSAGLFELFDEPITLVLDGSFSFDEDVAPDLLRRSVSAIVLDGKISAPRRLVPMLQLLCIARDGKIESFDDQN